MLLGIARSTSIPNNMHITLVMLAHVFLTGICAQSIPLASPVLVPEASATRAARPLLPLTVPEVRHLLGRLICPPPSRVKLAVACPWWRRLRRRGASYFH